jgi:hypothetical protein
VKFRVRTLVCSLARRQAKTWNSELPADAAGYGIRVQTPASEKNTAESHGPAVFSSATKIDRLMDDDTGSDAEVMLRPIEEASRIVINLNGPNIETFVKLDVQSTSNGAGQSGVSLGEVSAR